MHAFLFISMLFGQADLPLPPIPVPVPAADLNPPQIPETRTSTSETVQDLKTWLLTRLIVDLTFDTQKSAEIERMLDRMSEQQLRVLVSVYKERASKQDQLTKAQQASAEQQALDQAKLNQQQAEAYRNFLTREYDRRILVGHMTQNLVYQSILNNQRAMFYSQPYTYGGYGYGGYGYGGLGYRGLGYGAVNYGGFGYGAPGFGGPGYYGGNFYRGGYW